MAEPTQLPQLRALILAAFDVARSSGRADWSRMQTGVLKNRLLQMTQRTFRESDYGFASFSELVSSIPSILCQVPGSQPPMVELSESARTSLGPATAVSGTNDSVGRLRRDLWRAVIDYSNADGWVWDASKGVAVPSTGATSEWTLPTLTPAILAEWRNDFAAAAAKDGIHSEAVAAWAERGLPTSELPSALQPVWNESLKRRALERLEAWFSERSISLPSDAIETVNRDSRRQPGPSVSGLRRLLHECIDVMTEEELKTVMLPVEVVVRARH